METDIRTELSRGVLPASALRERLGVSPATLMRMVHRAGPDVLRIGRGRATRYALAQIWPDMDRSRVPLFRITRSGDAMSAGDLVTLAARQTLWLAHRRVSGGGPDGRVHDGLPIELADIRPSGFLGRHFAAVHADLRLPPRLADWSDHHILLAMSRRGEDLPGDLVAGEESFTRWQTLGQTPATRDQYPALADATIAGHPPASSAGGERPKFGVLVEGAHRLVKFAARGPAVDVVARRWCDLLILEALALDIIAADGIAAAGTRLIDTPSHWFLESERFDRAGARGRIAVLSLAAAHDNPADSWARAATALRDAGRLGDDDARRLRWLDTFGALIANTDRHHYNVSFFVEDAGLRLAPAFDQVSMLYAPTADGQVPHRVFALPTMTSDTLDVWDDARRAARQFWERGSQEARLSDDARSWCAANVRLLG